MAAAVRVCGGLLWPLLSPERKFVANIAAFYQKQASAGRGSPVRGSGVVGHTKRVGRWYVAPDKVDL